MKDDIHQTAYVNIDDAAERARLRYYPSRINQSIIYNEKVNESLDFLSEQSPDVSTYPFINAEYQATNKNPNQIAKSILQQRSKWLDVCAYIEQIRLHGKQQIAELTDQHEIRRLCEQTISTLDNIDVTNI